jgi:hypothetical protein
MLISTAMRTNDKLFNSPENIRYIFSLISLVKDMADKSEIKYEKSSIFVYHGLTT